MKSLGVSLDLYCPGQGVKILRVLVGIALAGPELVVVVVGGDIFEAVRRLVGAKLTLADVSQFCTAPVGNNSAHCRRRQNRAAKQRPGANEVATIEVVLLARNF